MKATLQKLSDLIAGLPEAQRREIEDAMVAMVESYLALLIGFDVFRLTIFVFPFR